MATDTANGSGSAARAIDDILMEFDNLIDICDIIIENNNENNEEKHEHARFFTGAGTLHMEEARAGINNNETFDDLIDIYDKIINVESNVDDVTNNNDTNVSFDFGVGPFASLLNHYPNTKSVFTVYLPK